ncbi:putative secreted lipase [Fulvia fulva]|uniref:Carboxylic ester hydrolase n=1 Tax=Passalora fulva TaxID=5499 RepID=A0A9Q8P6T0_PASFU|nr:putative secreted lipase [Fulvia fulva]KAK4629226.1 putative secreted lipase [Fulvia fulva]KAK4630018.1 putative secreted lipase [Fulvia fulva]UJO15271.1 putative secreted lipase [Fulvia fulva]WPV12899.1 putative secreted lipase [Fulvia fulva]WPV27434.1 putative secreted lipase [Fulvia fulva]
MLNFLILPLLSAVALAAPLDERQSGPSVTIQNGTVVGSSFAGVDSFKGIPFAQPPVGNLRLRPPQSINKSFGTLQATGMPKGCPQFISQVNTGNLPQDALGMLLNSPLVQTVTNSGEDCLTINVQRPAGVSPSAKLPVLYWIYGGGFEAGSAGMYDGSSIVKKSVSQKQPIIYVNVNYRLGGFGFLAGKDLANEHSTNLGLRDQRLGLQWVAENIAAFGGDPDKVTIWGESAGAISVADQTLINGGDNTYKGKPLFRGAIMDSGSIIPAQQVTTQKPQAVFDTVVENAGCSAATDRLACLRSLDYTTFLNAANSVPGIFSYRSVDLAYLPRPDSGDNFFPESPDIAINAGRFTKVPVIIGDQEDEGTLFSLVQGNITTNDQLVTYLASYFPDNANANGDIRTLLTTYPNQPILGQPAGSPFRTAGLNNIYPQFKRLAAVLGDITFTLTRRVYLSVVGPQVKSWSYLSTYLYGTPILGTFHGSDVIFAYGLAGPSPITDSIQTYFVNFVNNLDPNVGATGQTLWPQWQSGKSQLLNFEALRNSLLADDFRQASYQDLAASQTEFRI